MWIKNTNPETHPTRALSDDELTDGERVEFTENWKANVPADVGEALCDEYDHFVPVENEDETPN